MSSDELATLPTSGSAWDNLKKEADSDCGTPDLSNQDQNNNVCIMAEALVFARTGGTSYRSDVVSAIRSIVNSGTYSGRALALGRELGAYAISADLIGLSKYDSSLDQQFRAKLVELRTTPTSSGPTDLIDCSEREPTNWGTACRFTRAAIAAYLADSKELDRIAYLYRGWLGDRANGYTDYGWDSDKSWQCDSSAPVGINPKGCTKNGDDIGGVLPEDQRRCGSFAWPPCTTNYEWTGLEGAIAGAWILYRQGYNVFQWSDRALLRAFRWLYDVDDNPAVGNDRWQPYLMRKVYGSAYTWPMPSGYQPGKMVGWTEWTHQ